MFLGRFSSSGCLIRLQQVFWLEEFDAAVHKVFTGWPMSSRVVGGDHPTSPEKLTLGQTLIFSPEKKIKKLRHWCTFLDSRVNAPSEHHRRFSHQFAEPMCEPCHSFWDIHLTRWLFATNRKTRKRPQGNHCTLGGHVIGTTRSPTCNISDDVPLFGSLSHDKVVWGREGGGRVGGETCGFCSSIHPQVSCHLPACCC